MRIEIDFWGTDMESFPVLAVSLVMRVMAVLFVLCAVVLVLVILIQKGRGGGLSSAFGGSMAGGLLGSKTGDFLTWVTIVTVGVFLLLAIVMAKFYRPTVSDISGPPPRRAPAVPPGQRKTPPPSRPAPTESETSEPVAPPGEPGVLDSDAAESAEVNSP
ncbi:MAG: preprotein translocase subunit SecG [Planctomycetota bacterium]